MWDPRSSKTVWASTACYRDNFTFYKYHHHVYTYHHHFYTYHHHFYTTEVIKVDSQMVMNTLTEHGFQDAFKKKWQRHWE
jgi:hypothetical protein